MARPETRRERCDFAVDISQRRTAAPLPNHHRRLAPQTNDRYSRCNDGVDPAVRLAASLATCSCSTSAMRTLIKNATVVFPDGIDRRSVVIEGTRIAEIDPAAQLRVDEVIDAAGLHLHARRHRRPGPFPRAGPDAQRRSRHRQPRLRQRRRHHVSRNAEHRAARDHAGPRSKKSSPWPPQKSLVNYGFYIGATRDNLDELKAAHRTPGIKIFIGSSTGDLLVDEQAALERIFAETTLPITAHCEDETTVRANAARLAGTHDVADHSRIRDHAAALIATRRAIDLAHRHQPSLPRAARFDRRRNRAPRRSPQPDHRPRPARTICCSTSTTTPASARSCK